uniref:allene oxide synthase-lipoxygenase protein-like n=1 Tax=Styela clava TaxID=7725 RepID=UPI00193ADB4D|nr:allene oxide synthase-lipoxygenase protein-like [Styela clava]
MLGSLRSLSSSAKSYLKVPNIGGGADSTKILYTIIVKTGEMKFAGTDANVYFSLTGAGGDKTSRIKLDNTFRDDFERASTDKFKVKLEDIGIPTLVTLEIDTTGLFADWFASSVTVQKSGDKAVYEFPVYSWVDGMAVVPIGSGRLPLEEENSVLIDFRDNELSSRRRLYKWRAKDDPSARGLPGYIAAPSHDGLPRNLQFTDGLYKDFEDSKGVIFMHNVQEKIQALSGELIETWESLEEMSIFLSHPRLPNMPEFQKNWLDDAEFGRQLINGCNPNAVSRCDGIPNKFPVTDSMVKKFIRPGSTLREEIERGNIYIVDCKIANNIKQHPNACAPICLLYQNSDGDLLPIAIQLRQQSDDETPIWTPDDSEYDWMLAKMYFRSAEGNIQQIVNRLMYTHLVLEPFAVAMFRCLSSRHPVFKILHPHLRFVCAANTIARTSLFVPDGIFDRLLSYGAGGHMDLLREAYKSFDFSSLNVKIRLKEQGADSLNKFHYMEDATQLYNAIQKYMEKMVYFYYKNDTTVVKDTEVQSFIKEVYTEGFAWEDGISRGCPRSFSNKKELVEVLTMIIFTSSCQQAAVNSGQMDTFMHVPNSPLVMSKPPPTTKRVATVETVTASLPNKRQSCLQFDLVHAFAKSYEDEVQLGNFPDRLFCDAEAQDIIESFRNDLKIISKEIKERNSKLKIPYEYLLPEKIPEGVTV